MHTMESAFSVDEISDAFWASPASSSVPAMNRSQSEWAFEKFLEEVSPSPPPPERVTVPAVDSSDSVSHRKSKIEGGEKEVVEVKKDTVMDSHVHRHHFTPPPLDPSSVTAPVGSDSYRAFLKTRLDLACAAVALSRVSALKPGDSTAPLVDNHSQVSRPSLLSSQAHGTGNGFTIAQSEPDGGPLGIPALPAIQKKSGVQVRQTTSESSREESDDDELDGDMETTDNMDPADAKRARRMRSNRESARRSRRRKQEQMNELETQVGQLKIEHSSLLKRFTDANSKYDEAAVDNRILKADIETLRAKVKMAEERVKRVTGFNPLLLAMSNITHDIMPFVGSRIDASTHAALPIPPNPNPYFNAPVPNITAAAHNNGFPTNSCVSLVGNSPNDVVRNLSETSAIQHVANIDHVQQQIRPGNSSSGAMPHWDTGLTHPVSKNNKK